jgi:hypothetical protein
MTLRWGSAAQPMAAPIMKRPEATYMRCLSGSSVASTSSTSRAFFSLALIPIRRLELSRTALGYMALALKK